MSPQFAEQFVEHQRRSVLYTEYDGIFLFQVTQYTPLGVRYQYEKGTMDDLPIARALLAGDSISSEGSNLAVCEGSTTLHVMEVRMQHYAFSRPHP